MYRKTKRQTTQGFSRFFSWVRGKGRGGGNSIKRLLIILLDTRVKRGRRFSPCHTHKKYKRAVSKQRSKEQTSISCWIRGSLKKNLSIDALTSKVPFIIIKRKNYVFDNFFFSILTTKHVWISSFACYFPIPKLCKRHAESQNEFFFDWHLKYETLA